MTAFPSAHGAPATKPAFAEVLEAGAATTVQDWPGRIGCRQSGVPPSGPMDDLALRIGNRIVGNTQGAAGLEIVARGPTMRLGRAAVVCLAGATIEADIDGRACPMWRPVEVPAGGVLRLGSVVGPGARTYLLVRGGFDVCLDPGSRSASSSGRPGDLAAAAGDRALSIGDRLGLGDAQAAADQPLSADRAARMVQHYGHRWELRVVDGPHAAPEFFTEADIDRFYSQTFEVREASDRSGVRLLGPRPEWARRDGGDSGLHPSSIPDSACPVGAVMYRGDHPTILGPDGPVLGGFACPAVVIGADLWKLGQLLPGDKVAMRAVAVEEATLAERQLRRWLDARGDSECPPDVPMHTPSRGPLESAVLWRRPAAPRRPEVTCRRSGEGCLLVEYGPPAIDLESRIRVQLLFDAVEGTRCAGGLRGILDVIPGVRSLQVHFDPLDLPPPVLLGALEEFEDSIGSGSGLRLPGRTVHLPLSWNDAGIAAALSGRTAAADEGTSPGTRALDEMALMNGLDSEEDLRRIVFGAAYLVLGFGDSGPGGPVAAPLDPRHRVISTRREADPPWAPEGTVGLGGGCLRIRGTGGPCHCQAVGLTTPVRGTAGNRPGGPGLLRYFDQVRFFPVEARELLELRREAAEGRYEPRIEAGRFDVDAYHRFLASVAEDAERFHSRQQAAFHHVAPATR